MTIGKAKQIAFALLYVSLLPVLSYGSAQEVANQLFPKTVLLNIKDTSGRPLALDSGFILKKGYIVTNYHVVEGAGSGLVRRIGDKTNYKIVGMAAKDEFRDLVILEETAQADWLIHRSAISLSVISWT